MICACIRLQAHGDLHPRIEALTKEIAVCPTNALLFFERGELHRAHREWTNALSDYDAAQKLDPNIRMIHYCRGRLWLDAEEPAKAIDPLNRYLAGATNDANAFATRARAYAALGKRQEAADDFSRSIAITPAGAPELYVERAESLHALGKDEEALEGLDKGIARIGPLVTLELQAIDLDAGLKRFDSALKRLDILMSKSQRKESWLVRRGQILNQAGRHAEAVEAYNGALRAIERLPAAHRHTRTTLQLESSTRSALLALTAKQ